MGFHNPDYRPFLSQLPLPRGAHLGIELGCGRRKFDETMIGVDRRPLTNQAGEVVPNIMWDLEQTPFMWADDGCAGFVIAHQTLEHVRDLIGLMNDIHRICDDDAWVEIIVPHFRSEAAWRDPTHVRAFTPRTFDYWQPGMVSTFSDYGIQGHFAIGAQEWNADGNIWTILKPLKTREQYEAWWKWKETKEPDAFGRSIAVPAPAELAGRYTEHGFGGWPP